MLPTIRRATDAMPVNVFSLSQRLFILTAAALLPALGIVAYNEIALRQDREQEVTELAARLADLASLEMERIVTGAAGVMLSVTLTPAVRDFEPEGCRRYLADLTRRLPQITTLMAADTEGVVRCGNSESAIGQPVPDAATLIETLSTRDFAVGEFVPPGQPGGPGLRLASRMQDEDGTLIGVVFGTLGLDWLGRVMKERSFSEGSALTIADRRGTIIAREPLPERFVGTSIPEAFRSLVLADRPGTQDVLSQDGTRRVIGYQPATLPLGLYISAGVSRDEAFAAINAATQRGVALAVVGGAIAFFLAWLTGRTLVQRPIGRLLRTIEAWRRGQHSARTRMQPEAGEIEAVGSAIDALMDELEQRQQARREAEKHRDLVVRELNHRVKNLLATVQAVAVQSFKGEGVRPEALQAFGSRLHALGSAHQLLTADRLEGAELGDTVRAAIGVFDSEVRSRFSVEGPAVTVKPKAGLVLSMALHELCTNAVKYGALGSEDGRVAIRWSITDEEDRRVFRFSWIESGGPPVAPPTRSGFGSRMIQRALGAELDARVELDFRPEGLHCRIEGSADRLSA